MFKKNPKLKPSQVSINCVVQAISDDKTWDEISESAKVLRMTKIIVILKRKQFVKETCMDTRSKQWESLNRKQIIEIPILSTRLTTAD